MSNQVEVENLHTYFSGELRGYATFEVVGKDFRLEGLYRIFDPENGPDMTLVSVDYGYEYPEIKENWEYLEEILHKSTAGSYDTLKESHERAQVPIAKVGIFQIREGDEYHNIKFARYSFLEKKNLQPTSDTYELIYTGMVDFDRANPEESLEKLFAKLNDGTPHPSNYYGHSLSVSDVVVVNKGPMAPEMYLPGDCYYVDSFGFKKIENFFDKDDANHMKERFMRDIEVNFEANLIAEIHKEQREGDLKEWAFPKWLLDENYLSEREQILAEYEDCRALAELRRTLTPLEERMQQANAISKQNDIKQFNKRSDELEK